ncbi:hypothetical protein ANTHOS_280 [Bacillus phage Anthos]|uniref:Uncharacterized protein n=3 Tax=Caudoviricetes TaxID=2731619 RepID=A0A7U3T8Y8_9CAUD|nr:hypothetical protein AVV02_gp291 [Bacillus phage AvesoBmore]ALA13430.1 hypothetical protein AVESOBMORE_291 [Bacillus phage AvesoBmore]QDH49980.1 hypothetical protein BEYONPHE_293 [Bacillus phage Beyonphe]QPY77516.1 hypothetical protein ANTHOS_280 [Bacillus phage Anthos]
MKTTIHYANEYNMYDWFNNIAERKIQVEDIDAGSLINIYKAFIEKYEFEKDWRRGKSEITPALQGAIAIIEKYMLKRLEN